jgi:hypothetical protein
MLERNFVSPGQILNPYPSAGKLQPAACAIAASPANCASTTMLTLFIAELLYLELINSAAYGPWFCWFGSQLHLIVPRS